MSADAASAKFESALTLRQRQLDALSVEDFDAIPHGPALLDRLRNAWDESIQADQAFDNWALESESSAACGTDDSFFAQGETLSKQASADKAAFVTAYNQYVAVPLSVPLVTEAGL